MSSECTASATKLSAFGRVLSAVANPEPARGDPSQIPLVRQIHHKPWRVGQGAHLGTALLVQPQRPPDLAFEILALLGLRENRKSLGLISLGPG